MATRARATTPLLFLLATSLLFSAAFSTSYDEEEGRRGEHWLKQCVQRCQEDRPRYQQSHCLQECRDKQQQQPPEWQHGRHEEEREEEHGRGRGRRGEGEREEEHGRRGEGEHEQEQGQGQGDSRRPYVFSPRSFRSIIQSDHGFVKALPPFNQESRLLRGIKNYRVAIMEVNPRSFVLPGFTDADGIGYVAQGEGVLTVIENGEKRSYKVRQGDVIVAPAGSLMHLANTDGRRKLVIAKILNTISVPGKFQFFSAEPLVASLSKRVQREKKSVQTVCKSLSRAAFKKSYERLEKLLDRQGEKKKKDFIVRASEEQLRELSRQASEGGQGHHWPLPPFRGDSQDTFNLLEQRPKIANRHGRLYEADARTFRALAGQDIRVAVANITAGSMTAPYYNTQSVKFAVVLEGEGEVEIVCPHLSQRQGRSDTDRRREREQGKGRSHEEEEDERRGSESEEEEDQQDQQRYQTIRARVSRGSAFVVPPGHPVVEISSSGANNNLQVVCFEIRARNNDRVWLAGKNNVIADLDSPAKVLTFGAPAKEVDQVFRADDQQEEGFLPGPQQSRQQERGEEEERHHRRRGDRGSDEESMGAFLRMATSAF